MKTKIMVLLASILLCGYGTASASDVDITLSCPATVKVGRALKVTVKPYNYGDTAVSLSRYMTAVVANGTNAVGTAAFYGPFAKTLANPKSLAKLGGTTAAFSVPVTTAPKVANKMALVILNFINNQGQDIGSDSCLVNIVP